MARLPTDKSLPSVIKEFYMEKRDFEISDLDQEKMKAFKQLVTELQHDFTVYKAMFGDDRARQSTNKLGKDVMLVVERSLLTQICIRYAAILHDNNSNRGKEEVISFNELIKPLKSTNLQSKYDGFKDFYESSKLKKWRNKVIAHNDFKLFKERSQHIPNLSTAIIERQLELLIECLNDLSDKSDVYTEVDVQLSFTEGVDKYNSALKKI